MLVGNTQTRELHLMDAGCAIASLKNHPGSFAFGKLPGWFSLYLFVFYQQCLVRLQLHIRQPDGSAFRGQVLGIKVLLGKEGKTA